MSPQLIELIIFAGIAVLVIGKFIGMLGKYDEDDPMKNKVYFGENSSKIKDVSEINQKSTQIIEIDKYIQDKDLIDSSNIKTIKEGIEKVQDQLGTLIDLKGFIKKSKVAFDFILDAIEKNNDDILSELVDKRFITKLKQDAHLYKDYKDKTKNIRAIINSVYSFGNNCFIKIKFSNEDENFNEEWVFTKSAQDNTKIWYLSNIERD